MAPSFWEDLNMNRFITFLLFLLVPMLSYSAPYKRITNIDTDVFDISSKGQLSIKSTATGLTFADLSVGDLSITGTLAHTDTATAGASVGPELKTTLTAGDTFTATTGYKFKIYDADNTVVHSGGEHTGVYVNMKLLSAMQSGGKSVLYSGHNYGSGGDYQAIDAGVWLYGNIVDAFKISGGTSTTGIDLSEQTISSEEILLSNSEYIKNTTNGTVEIGSGVLKHAVDAAAYWTATQADAGSVTFDSVSDGTSGFAFSDPVSVTGDITATTGNQLVIGTETIAGESNADGLNVKRVARATYDFSEHGGTASTIGLGVTLPDNAIITRTYFEQNTAFTCTAGAGSCNIEYGWTGSTAALVAQAAENNAKYAGDAISDGVQDGTTAAFTKLDGAKEIAITIGSAVEAGKAVLIVEYIVSD